MSQSIYHRWSMSVKIRERLADLIKEAQGDRTQREFALQIGVSQPALQGWLSGDSFPNRINLKKIATVLGVTTDELERLIESGEEGSVDTVDEVYELVMKRLDREGQAQLLRRMMDRLVS